MTKPPLSSRRSCFSHPQNLALEKSKNTSTRISFESKKKSIQCDVLFLSDTWKAPSCSVMLNCFVIDLPISGPRPRPSFIHQPPVCPTEFGFLRLYPHSNTTVAFEGRVSRDATQLFDRRLTRLLTQTDSPYSCDLHHGNLPTSILQAFLCRSRLYADIQRQREARDSTDIPGLPASQ